MKMYDFTKKELKHKEVRFFSNGDIVRTGNYDIELIKKKYNTFTLETRVLDNKTWKYIDPAFWPIFICNFIYNIK